MKFAASGILVRIWKDAPQQGEGIDARWKDERDFTV